MTTPTDRPPGRKTYTRLAVGRRVPLEYELVSTDLHYNHPLRFELPAGNPVVAWYYRHREGSALQARSWEQFVDPRRGAVWPQVAFLGTLFVLVAALSDMTYGLVSDAIAGRLRRTGTGARLRRPV